jgi:hypothetical protein
MYIPQTLLIMISSNQKTHKYENLITKLEYIINILITILIKKQNHLMNYFLLSTVIMYKKIIRLIVVSLIY